ncbi:hypothetical protein [Mollivirus kamchatka]|nr:hypothetical protein [Mollivirus kamchatka]
MHESTQQKAEGLALQTTCCDDDTSRRKKQANSAPLWPLPPMVNCAAGHLLQRPAYDIAIRKRWPGGPFLVAKQGSTSRDFAISHGIDYDQTANGKRPGPLILLCLGEARIARPR